MEDVRSKFERLMYRLTKTAARNSWVDFLEDQCDLTEDDYDSIKLYLESELGVNTNKFYL